MARTLLTSETTLTRNVVGVHGAAGRAWLDALPALIAERAAAWGLTIGEAFADLSFNYVTKATRQGESLVLKMGVPSDELTREMRALQQYAASGASVRLLQADADRGALLLARVLPGDTLLSRFDGRSDDAATRAAAELMRRLHHTPPSQAPLENEANAALFPTVERWGDGFARHRARYGGGSGPLPLRDFAQAERLFADLAASPLGPPVLLHGDLHHGNILATKRGEGSGEEEWIAIDPKGVWGEAAYEAGAILRNPWPALLTWDDVPGILARRVAIFAEVCGWDAARVRDWGRAQAILSSCWLLEDGDTTSDGWQWGVKIAEALTHAAA